MSCTLGEECAYHFSLFFSPSAKGVSPTPCLVCVCVCYVSLLPQDLFLVHGASIEQLKAVCKGLLECEGFNSEGWIKSRVSGKRRATIDLYLKQVARAGVEGQSAREDQAAGVFLEHMTQYNQMEQQLKMYPSIPPIGALGHPPTIGYLP